MSRSITSRLRRGLSHSQLSLQRLEPRLALAVIDPICVPVGNARNAADPTTGYGRVTEAYRIGKYEVTIGEYAAFLNAVATDDPAGLYHDAMATDRTSAGIVRAGTTEDQWYKAAFDDPALRKGRGGSFTYATRSNAAPGNVIGDAANQVNYIFVTGAMTVTQQPTIDPTQNYLTNVGAMRASPSSYGTFDQNGNV
jgi:formylglycine-generating enzyme required for sulfatase activity